MTKSTKTETGSRAGARDHRRGCAGFCPLGGRGAGNHRRADCPTGKYRVRTGAVPANAGSVGLPLLRKDTSD